MPFILWRVPASCSKASPTTWCCHPQASRLGWCSSACKPHPFSSKHNDSHYGQTALFLFHQTRGHFSKKYDLCPHGKLQSVVFYDGSSLGNRTHLLPERYDGYMVPWCLYLRTIVCTDERGTYMRLEIAPKDKPDLWRSTKENSEVLADLFRFSHDVKQRGTGFNGRP